MTEQEIAEAKTRIDTMSRIEMARMWRFTPLRSGHPYFDSTLPLAEYFKARFLALGGFSPEISKEIGLY